MSVLFWSPCRWLLLAEDVSEGRLWMIPASEDILQLFPVSWTKKKYISRELIIIFYIYKKYVALRSIYMHTMYVHEHRTALINSVYST